MPDVFWEYNTTERKESGRFLECVEDKFLMQLVKEPNSEDTPLDLLFAKRKGRLCYEKIRGHLGHSSPEMIRVSSSHRLRRGISRTATLDFQRADLGLIGDMFRELLERQVVEGSGVPEGWTFFGTGIFKTQGQTVPMCWKMSQQGRKAAWLNRELWRELRRGDRKSVV